jgi:hypothetical protein
VAVDRRGTNCSLSPSLHKLLDLDVGQVPHGSRPAEQVTVRFPRRQTCIRLGMVTTMFTKINLN